MKFNERKPDLIMNGDIGIECKNWDPEAETKMNSHDMKTKVIERFEGDKEWVKKKVGSGGWKRKILVIPNLQPGYDPKKVKKLMNAHSIDCIDGFPYVTENPKIFIDATDILYREFTKEKMKGKL